MSHDADALLTKLAVAPYHPEAQCPTFDAFLWRIMGENQDLINFVQRAAGYNLTGDTGEQCFFLCYGRGSNGKSTLLDTLRALVGDYGKQTDFSTFLQKRSDTIRNDLAALAGVRFACAIEAGEGQRLAETIIKQLTGGDSVSARFLHREFFEFKPAFKAWLAANHTPEIRGTDHAMWRRVRLIPFTVTIPDEEIDKGLGERLLLEELPGILAWAVRGCMEWQRLGGLGEPAAVLAATGEYREEMDVIAGFLSDCCMVGDGYRVGASDLYAAYKVWAEGDGDKPLSNTKFGRRLTERGIQKERTTGGRYQYVGLGLA